MKQNKQELEQETYLSTRKAAGILGVSLRTVQLWVENGTLQAWKTAGGHRRILMDSVSDILKERNISIDKHSSKDELVMVLVDDDAEIRDAYSLSISMTGLPIKLITAANGYEGLLKIGQYHPDIIMTDLMMPNMNGYEMLKAIKAEIDISNSEIIVVTAMDKENVNLKEIIDSGITLFHKPLKFESIEKIMVKILEEKQSA